MTGVYPGQRQSPSTLGHFGLGVTQYAVYTCVVWSVYNYIALYEARQTLRQHFSTYGLNP